MRKDYIKTQFEANLTVIENKKNYYAMFGIVLDFCAEAKLLNYILFNSDEITDEEFRNNVSRIHAARELAIVTHGKWVAERLEKSKTQHTVKSLVSSIYSDIYNIQIYGNQRGRDEE